MLSMLSIVWGFLISPFRCLSCLTDVVLYRTVKTKHHSVNNKIKYMSANAYVKWLTRFLPFHWVVTCSYRIRLLNHENLVQEATDLQYLDHPRDQTQSSMSLGSLHRPLLSDIAPYYLTVLVTLHYIYMWVCGVNTVRNTHTHFGLIMMDYRGILLHDFAC